MLARTISAMSNELVRYEAGAADLTRPLLDDICRVYYQVFSQKPFFWRDDESDLHRERLLSLPDDPTFAIVTATRNDLLIGFGYGFTVSAQTKRWTQVMPTPPPDV